MTNTKEKILMTALHLFARDGYEAVSVSTIAGSLGMTKAALYKHYKNKRDIFDSIVERMYKIDAERAQEYEVPEERYEDNPGTYENISINKIKEYTVSQFIFWTEDEFASDFRKMLILEQYRNEGIAKLHSTCITAGPVAYMEDIFREMIKRGILREADPGILAVDFYAPLYLLINIFDYSKDKEKTLQFLNKHIDRFFECNSAEKSACK